MKGKNHFLAYMFMLPAFTMILLFFFLPVILTFAFSFTNMGSTTGITSNGHYTLNESALKELKEKGMDEDVLNKIGKQIFYVSTKKLSLLAETFPDLEENDIERLNELEGNTYQTRRNLEREIKQTIRTSVRERKKISLFFNASMLDKKYMVKNDFIDDLDTFGIHDNALVSQIVDATYSGWTWTFENYQNLFGGSEIWKIAKNTFIYVFFTLGFFNISFALLLALSTFFLPKGQGLLFRSIWLIPRISPAVIYVLLWKWFTFDTGFLPKLLGIESNIMLELAPFTTVIFINGFIGTSMGMIIFSSALQGIGKPILNASMVDGASRWQQTIYILLPQLKWPILFIATYQTLSLLTSFDYIFLSTNGGPGYNTTMVWALYIFQEALYNDFGNYRYGYGSALAVVLVVVGIVMTVVYLKVFKFNELSAKPLID